MSLADAAVIILAVLLAVGRIGGLKDPAFQAAAHLVVGGLAVAWWYGRRTFHAAVFWTLTVVEVICFLVGRFHS